MSWFQRNIFTSRQYVINSSGAQDSGQFEFRDRCKHDDKDIVEGKARNISAAGCYAYRFVSHKWWDLPLWAGRKICCCLGCSLSGPYPWRPSHSFKEMGLLPLMHDSGSRKNLGPVAIQKGNGKRGGTTTQLGLEVRLQFGEISKKDLET